ncbi:conserved hypothetical protein [Chlamydia pneumoniae LPCoLN]|uniref:hypothetical protein n=1 Tax=Chlamydia pneumoniae TaxID=83558 RepID=UPI0001BD9D97|nr:hypothetical protein [Chlamydia pneumoniae]ACZ32562.1 conserved hypothetical protein [Chlamydia pneumoniae LPCoLN]
MSVNPSGNSKNDLWITGAHDQHPDVKESGVTSANLGSHRVTASGGRQGLLARIKEAVTRFFSRMSFFRSGAPRGSQQPSAPSADTVHSPLPGGDARATEGAGRNLIKKGYQPGMKVTIPQVPGGGAQRSSGSATLKPTRPAPPPPKTGGTNAKRPATHGKGPAPQPPKIGGTNAKRAATHGKGPAPQPPKGILKQPGQSGTSGKKRVSWSDEDSM